MRITPLPKKEVDICKRLKLARERIEITQAGCADAMGIERTTLANLELARAPVRYEIALRFCRNLIVNEEYLATGKYTATHQAALSKPNLKDTKKWDALDKIFFRHCVDLLSEPICNQITPGALFSDVYERHLSGRFSELIHDYFYLPRIVFTETDKPDVALRLLGVLQGNWVELIKNEADRRGKDPVVSYRQFTRCLIESNAHIFRKFMGFSGSNSQLDWLRKTLDQPDAFLGPSDNSGMRRDETRPDIISFSR